MRNLLTPQVPSRIIANGPIVWTDGDAVNGHSADNSGEINELIVRNTNAGAQWVKILKRFTADGNAFVEQELSLAAGETYKFPPFENTYYGWADPDNGIDLLQALAIDVESSDVKLAWTTPGARSTVTA